MLAGVLAAVLLEEPPQAVSREAAMPAAIRPLRILLLFFITLTPLSLNWYFSAPLNSAVTLLAGRLRANDCVFILKPFSLFVNK